MLRELFAWILIAALGSGYVMMRSQLRETTRELNSLRAEAGFLPPGEDAEIAAIRTLTDQPLTYRFRVRTPESLGYRVAYSSLLPREAASPAWFAAADLPGGEAIVTVRVQKDPRDERWKISTLVQSERGNKRVATVLPQEHVDVFRGSHEVVSTGIGRGVVRCGPSESLRLLDERWLVGDGSLLLYGQRPPDRDQIGVYAELQPDAEPL